MSARFWSKVDKADDEGCWLWTAARNAGGYGQFRVANPRRLVYAHRFSYELHVGPIPEGLEVDHLCRTRACVNPAHLEAVTTEENMRRASEWAAANIKYCKHGHPLFGENVYIRPSSPNRRECRTCKREANRVIYHAGRRADRLALLGPDLVAEIDARKAARKG